MDEEQNGNVNEDQSQPKPYPVNRATFKVQDTFLDGDTKYALTTEFKRLDADNFRLLLDKEKSTKRISETLTKGRSRDRLNVDEAHGTFFDAIAIQGWIKADDEEEETLEYQALKELVIERKISLNVKYLDCKAIVKKTTGAEKHSFLFEKEGHMIVEFLIGDPDFPTFKILLKSRRPRQVRRSQFRENFAYGITSRGGDLPITETYIDLPTGVRMFDEFFDTVVDDPNYSPIAFLNGDNTLDHNYVEGNEEDKKKFIQFFNPHYKVEIAGAMIATFSKSSRES